ncbi:HepT-like ribonuclease domain-containing protein [Adlercreutzia sp. R25]|uniref:HepT-like ribonuclease domain-containing protein n=1 Tax=Adlercreutzia shanghongiae TaxID=3111773 RepID=UPI002DBC06FB|nr:HepT-like ribonuclease domain-containing protein [Adlercreutzia sp. R25]MEC4272884.1 HepT-like ribonuclease domain-containing protein [Adlercreutzia sp. R25]
MNARENDLLRIQEIYDIATQTIAQLDELRICREQFVRPASAQEALIGEGLANRVFRAAEEGGRLSQVFVEYGFELREMSGLRNRLAHAYGTVDMHVVWDVLQHDFPKLVAACEAYCEERGIALARTWGAPQAVSETSGPDEGSTPRQ